MTSRLRCNDDLDGNEQEYLSQAQSLYELFQRDGFVGPVDVLTEDEADHAYKEIEQELLRSSSKSSHGRDEKGNDSNGTNNNDRFKLHLILPSVDRIVHHPNVVNAVRAVLGLASTEATPPDQHQPQLLLWSSDVNIKRKDSNGVFEPHQDSTYAGLSDPSKCVTVWIALHPRICGVTKENGGLLFWPQSHTVGQIPHSTNKNERRLHNIGDDDKETISSNDNNNEKNNNMLSLGQYVSKEELGKLPRVSTVNDRDGEDEPFVSIPLKVGQATIHSFYNVHASGPNRSSTKDDRVGIALRYMVGNGQVKQLKKNAREMVTIVQDNFGGVGVGVGEGFYDDQNNNVLCTQEVQGFDVEPRLPPNPTHQDIERQRSVRDEAMRREEANYFG